MNRKMEAMREKEVSRIAPELFVHVRSHLNSSSSCNVSNDTHAAFPAVLSDPALNAFAQLGALKLDAKRCRVSLFDRRNQYVVAESTNDSVLGSCLRNDEIWLDGMVTPRGLGICEHVLISNDGKWEHTGAKLDVSVVPDLAADARFSDNSYVLGTPYIRFYAGVPLKSRNGVNVGVLAVLDDQPRAGLDESQLDCLRELSRIITGYFELKESAPSFRRSERMVRGLGSFVEGKTTMSGWELGANSGSFRNNGSEGDLNMQQQSIRQRDDNDDKAGHNDDLEQSQRPAPIPLQPVSRTEEQTSVQALPNHKSGPGDSATFTVHSTSSARTISTIAPSEEPQLKEVKVIFSRAANIIRESIEVEGVLFLDASVFSYGGLVSDVDVHSRRSSSSSRSPPRSEDDLGQESEDDLKACNVLGYSTSTDSSIDCTSPSSPDVRVPEKFLRALLKRYSMGKVFNFDEDGATLQSTDDDQDQPARRLSTTGSSETVTVASPGSKASNPYSRKNEDELMLSMFPGARSVALVPLWDARRERWFAGSFIWTKAPARLFTSQGEISYLRAFSTTIMAEVDRVNTSNSERAKSDLLGSLSHELRSPLHGIVAAVELLQDTDLDAFQGGLLQTMDACGRTLLDVIDHLLDYTKISRLVRGGARDRRGSPAQRRTDGMDKYQSFQSQLTALSSTMNLDALVEETAESIFTGHISQALPASLTRHESLNGQNTRIQGRSDSVWSAERFVSPNSDTSPTAVHQPVPIYLEIDPHVSWICRVEAGAIRRVLMNLLGNSLKYTKYGFIRVSLKQEQRQAKRRKPYTQVVLNVSDSGKGITQEFLQHRAFKPFTQEDPLSQGTGIGLSLVSQIVQGLGGTVHIESQLGCGTSVTISVPLKTPLNLDMRDSPFAANVAALRGLRVSLCGLRTEPDCPGIANFISPVELDVVTTVCCEWLHLEVVEQGSTDIRPDIIVRADTSLGDVSETTTDRDSIHLPVVVVCRSVFTAQNLSMKFGQASSGRIYEFISQPIGPRKLANAMVLALGRYNDAKASDLVPSQPSDIPQNIYINPLATPDYTPGVEFPSMSGWTPEVVLLPSQPSEPHLVSVQDFGLSTASLGQKNTDNLSSTSELGASATDQARDVFLLVDDNKINLQILVSFMMKLKYTFRTATNGLEAFEIFSENPESFTHILMDISMPVMDGLESTRRIRELEGTRRLRPSKIIALTGLVSANAQQEAFASGVDMYMTKPVRFKDLSRVLEGTGHKL
ncbi:hypothetical protein JX265_001746 [Neoarthrinium moseri]|uniref:histidine kinase n=1 Tax=Neoarthrinium moseri TaxID=1658444 RepID=A0A9P9WW09_9PEZI|nr:hypothetical protein JX265_001746 [Neoarthrinium moseri]